MYGNNTLNTHGMENGRKGKGKHLTKMTPLTCHILRREDTAEGRAQGLLLHWTDLLFSIEEVIIRTKRIILPTVRRTPDWISFCYQANRLITLYGRYL